MKIKNRILKLTALLALILLSCALAGCSGKNKIFNNANLTLDLGIGNTHFEDESSFPLPAEGAYLDIYESRIIICDAYETGPIETPLIYNTSSTAHPRMKLETSGNRMFVIYCPDISMPNLQFATTNDGGETWQQSTFSLSGEMDTIDDFIVSFWTQRDGALIASNGSIETFVYITGDSGKNWEKKSSAPPEQDWHELLDHGTFLNKDIGFISYEYYSKPANQPNIYFTKNGSESWEPMNITVPDTVMENLAVAGKPFYDGEKINVPIDLYNKKEELVKTIYYVSFDLAQNWEFYVDDGGKSEQLRLDEMEKWLSENRNDKLWFADYDITKFEEYEVFDYSDDTRIDIYRLESAYKIGDNDWSRFSLTKDMYFDDQMRLCYKDSSGWPLLFFIYKGDVFKHTYEFIGAVGEKTYESGDSKQTVNRLIADKRLSGEIAQLFSSASNAYSWFTPFVSDSIYQTDSYIDFGGIMYNKAVLGDITSASALEEHLKQLFTDSTVGNILGKRDENGNTIFAESDGALYRLRDFIQANAGDGIKYRLRLISSNDSEASVDVIIYKDENGGDIYLKYNCTLKKTANGWRFDSFKLPVEYLNEHYSQIEDARDKTITDIDQWDSLRFNGDDIIYEFIRTIAVGDFEMIAELLGYGSPYDYMYLGPLTEGNYTITRRSEKGQHVIILTKTDFYGSTEYTKYIRFAEGRPTLTNT